MNDCVTVTGAELSDVLERRIGDISSEIIARFAQYWPHSANVHIDEEFSRKWNEREVRDFLGCIASDGAGNESHAAWVGDATRVHFELFSPLFNRLEMILLYAEVCVEFLWEEYVEDAERLNAAVSTFERCVSRLVISDTQGYLDAKLAPGALAKTWRLGPHSVSAAVGDEVLSTTPDLSCRQKQIIRFVAEGKSNGEIAAALGISANTVRNHLAAIFDKLNVNNRTELALLADRKGLLEG